MPGSVFAACRATVDFAQPNPQLYGVNARINRAEAGVGDMHIAKLHAPIAAITEKVGPQRNAGCEVHTRSSRRHIMIGEQRPATQLKIWDDPSSRRKIPFQIEWVNSGSEGSVGWLEDKE